MKKEEFIRIRVAGWQKKYISIQAEKAHKSLSFETGVKFHQSAREMQQVKDYCSQLCREYGLSVTESKADPFRIPTWKRRLTDHIKEAMEQSRTQKEFVAYMNAYGYDVKWEPHQKYITYTTPAGENQGLLPQLH